MDPSRVQNPNGERQGEGSKLRCTIIGAGSVSMCHTAEVAAQANILPQRIGLANGYDMSTWAVAAVHPLPHDASP